MHRRGGKHSEKIGKLAEKICATRLRELGIIAEKIEPARTRDGKYLRQCSGDFWGILPPTGRSVLVEVKYRRRPLRISDFQPHQIAALRMHADAGGLSLIFHFDGRDGKFFEFSEIEEKEKQK